MDALAAAHSSNSPVSMVPHTTIPLGQMLRPQIVGGKVAVPVEDYSVYTQFKHISASPAGASGQGYSSSRLRILDTLIDRLIQMKERSVEKEGRNELGGLSSEAIDAMIRQYAGKYQQIQSKSIDAISMKFGTDFGVRESGAGILMDISY